MGLKLACVALLVGTACGRLGYEQNDAGFKANPCGDGKLGVDESDVDCGGICDTKCSIGSSCVVNEDCATGYCRPIALCAAPLEAIGSWQFDEGSGSITYDASDNASHGDMTSMDEVASWIGRGTGFALLFDGVDDVVDCGSNPALMLTDSMSVELWVRFDVFGAWETLVDNSLYSISHRGDWADDVLYFRFAINEANGVGDSAWSNNVSVHTTSRLVLNTWHHLVGTKDANTLAIYLDGVKEKQMFCESCFTVDKSIMQPLRLGNGLAGAIDDLNIYSRAMTEDEVRQRYLDGL